MSDTNKASIYRLQDIFKGKCKPGMLIYKEEVYPELDEPVVREAIHTRSVASKLPESMIRQTIVRSNYENALYTRKNFYESHADMYDSVCGCNCIQLRYEMQHEVANRNRHTSRHIPFYFPIFGQNRFVLQKNGRKDHTKFNRNVRPKGTHSNYKLYK